MCLSVMFSVSGTLLVIVLLTLFLGCGSVCLINDYSAMGTVRQCIQLVCAFVSCAFYFRYTSNHCLIDIVSLLCGCLSRQQLFSHGNSEVMHSACVCILSIVLSSSGTLLVIVSSTLFLRYGSVCLVDNYSAMGTVK